MTARTGRPHLLFVAWGFPPCRAGGVYRALATANAFAARGWDVTVLTAERAVFERYTGTDPSLEALVDPRIRVVRLPFAWPAQETDVRRYSWLQVNAPLLWRQARVRLDRLPFPEAGYGPWRATLEQAAERVHAERPVDLVLTTANPHVSFTAAWRLHSRYGVPYVLDYRDAWLLDVFSGDRLHGPRSRAARWERRLMDRAAQVWFVNARIRDWHAALYPDAADRLRVVANGFDRDQRAAPATARSGPDGPLVFGYVGTVTPKVPLAPLVEGWVRARRSCPELAGATAAIHGYLGYYRTPRADMLALLEDAAQSGLRYHGPVAHAEAGEVYAGFDALLLVLGSGRYVTSGKVFDYVSTGLPIVSVHDPDNAVSDVLRGYPSWYPVTSLAPDDVAAALAAAARDVLARDPAVRDACRTYAEQYARERQLLPRIEELRSTVAASALAPALEVAS